MKTLTRKQTLFFPRTLLQRKEQYNVALYNVFKTNGSKNIDLCNGN